MAVQGVDFANERPDPAALVRAGKHFVVRYLSPSTPSNPGKHLEPAELAGYRAAGMAVCVVWETTTTRATQGQEAGQQDARLAVQQLALLGFPANQPVYFAVDEDTSGASVADYFRGVADVIGLARTGSYAGYRVIKYLFDNHLITFGWQTYAWSNSAWDPRAQARQTKNGVTVAGQTVDLDEAEASDYGQWEADEVVLDSDIEKIAEAVWTYPGWTGAYKETPFGMLSDLRSVRDPIVQGLAAIRAAVDAIPTAADIAAEVQKVLPAGSSLTADEVATAVVAAFAAKLGGVQ